MSARRFVLGCAVLALQLAIALPAHAGVTIPGISSPGQRSAARLPAPRPSWYTAKLNKRVIAAGQRGLSVRLSAKQAGALNPNCIGYSPPSTDPSKPGITAVSAGGCMVAPYGCTMNYIFTDGTSYYIGTAGHCVQGKGSTVVMQVATRVDPTDSVIVTLAAIGKTVKKMDRGIGQDFGLVKIDPGWAVDPGIAGAAGPTGTFCGDPVGQPVVHYGHGYIFFVEQGDPKVGEVIPDLNAVVPFTSTQYGYNWVGYGLPGDSGSPVMDAGGLAVGDLTHGLAIAGVPIPGLNFGTDMAGIFNFLGSGYSLVTADGRRVNCSGSLPIGV